MTRRHRRGLVGLYFAVGVSTTGTRMSLVALPLFVYLTTGSAVQTGLVGFAEMLPYVVAKFLGGPLVDRIGPWRASVGSDAVAGVVMGTIPLLYAVHALPFGLLLALVALAGLLRAPGDAAKIVLLPPLVAAADVPMERAVGISDGINRLATMLGAPIGGALVALVGAPAVVALDAASFLAGSLVLALLVPRRLDAVVAETGADDAREATGSYLGQMREGLVFLRGQRFLRAVATMVAATNLLDAAVSAVLLPVWAVSRYGDQHGPAVMGLVSGMLAAGAVAGTAVVAAIGHRLPRRLTFALCFLVVGGPRIAVLALPVPLWVVVAVMAGSGFAAGAINPLLAAAEYERVPPPLQARVFGVLGAVGWAGIPFGGLVGGWLIAGIGLSPAVLVVAGAYLLITLDPWVRRGWRDMDRTSQPQPGLQRGQQLDQGPAQRPRRGATSSDWLVEANQPRES